MTSRGNLPGLRTGANPTPSAKATGHQMMKPRASGPTTISISLSLAY